MNERSSSEDHSHGGEWQTQAFKNAGDAVREANRLGLQPGAVVFISLARPGDDDGPVQMYWFQYFE
jgi:hypothetical protein